MSSSTDISSELYSLYKKKAFPKIEDRRGATKLLKVLKSGAYKELESVEYEPTSISELEWDNLIILDAARHDIYQEVRGYPVDRRITVGSQSPEFIEKTFSKGDWSDTVLVTANPYYGNFLPDRKGFFELTGRTCKAVFKEVYNLFESEWSEENGTVMPHKVCQQAIRAERRHSDSRKIIHFMQPHTPHVPAKHERGEIEQVWEQVESAEISKHELRNGYRKNLSFVLGQVDLLVEELSGRTIVTADHGDLLGENDLFGHTKKGASARAVREVPVEVFEEV